MTLRERGSGVKRARDPSDIRGGKALAAAVDVDFSPALRAADRRAAARGRTEDAHELAVLADGVGGNFHYCALFLGPEIAKPELGAQNACDFEQVPVRIPRERLRARGDSRCVGQRAPGCPPRAQHCRRFSARDRPRSPGYGQLALYVRNVVMVFPRTRRPLMEPSPFKGETRRERVELLGRITNEV